ncbi:MAG TPA: hypothetical protein VMI33_07540 [Streptosporangiaceae bacterium]|nr:hypothetical protein [Streptosporangiaceae bacterium]
MESGRDRPFVDAQYLTDLDANIYEAVATLEFAGRPATRAQIATAAGLDEDTVGEVLAALEEHGVLTRTPADGEDAFGLARRDWSAAPDTPAHDR